MTIKKWEKREKENTDKNIKTSVQFLDIRTFGYTFCFFNFIILILKILLFKSHRQKINIYDKNK